MAFSPLDLARGRVNDGGEIVQKAEIFEETAADTPVSDPMRK